MDDPTQRYEGREGMRALFKKLGLKYIERTLFSQECLDFLFMQKADYEDYHKHTDRYERAIQYYREPVQASYMGPVYVKWISEDVGYGLFAGKDIEEGDLIGEYAGVVSLKKLVKDRTWCWKYPIKGKFKAPFRSGVSVNGGEMGNELRFINHSDHRNTSPIMVHNGDTWVNCYYARKPIKQDEELTVNYGSRYWRTRKKIDL